MEHSIDTNAAAGLAGKLTLRVAMVRNSRFSAFPYLSIGHGIREHAWLIGMIA